MTQIHRKKKQLAKRDGQTCHECDCDLRLPGQVRNGRRTAKVHHVKLKSKGGSNRLENLVLICKVCHRFIHRKAA